MAEGSAGAGVIPTAETKLREFFEDPSSGTMKAAVLHDFDRLAVQDVPRPRPVAPGTVVVKVTSCGICATDYKAVKGIRRNVKFPFIPGHEVSGVVAEVGPGCAHFRPGDEVIVQPSGYCGFCPDCRRGNTHYCEHSFTTGGDGPEETWPGGFAQYMLTLERCLFAKPPDVSFDAAALTEPLSGAWKGVVKYSDCRLGDDVVIIGTGGIGLLCLMVARAAGAGRLVAVDPSAHAREEALRLGATHAVDPGAEDTKARVYEVIPEGPDLVVEAAGPVEAVRLMVSLLRRGTRWNVFGITTHEKFELDGGLAHFLEARMDASFGTTPEAMQNAVDLLASGTIDTGKIITHRFPLAEIHRALDALASPESTKVIVNP